MDIIEFVEGFLRAPLNDWQKEWVLNVYDSLKNGKPIEKPKECLPISRELLTMIVSIKVKSEQRR